MDNSNKVISKLAIKIANLEIVNANSEATIETLQEENQRLSKQLEQLKNAEKTKEEDVK